jgi:hypothetical protein
MLVLSVSAAIPERKPPKNARELEAFRHEITDKIKKLLNFKRFEQPLYVQPLVTTQYPSCEPILTVEFEVGKGGRRFGAPTRSRASSWQAGVRPAW